MNFVKNVAAGAVLGGSLLFTAGVGIANAQPAEAPDGLVNLTVGNVTILEGVSTETAATAAGAICGSTTADVDALVAQVDGDGIQQTVCAGLPGGDLVLTQNVSSSVQQPGLTDGTDVTDGVGTPGDAEATTPVDGG